MKYIEPVKSVVLFLLVVLSVVLTFIIWTYTPDYKFIEQTEGKEILIGPQKKPEDVIRPYKAIYRFDKEFTGTVSNGAMVDIMDAFHGWNILDLMPIDTNLKADSVNNMIRSNNCMTVFFPGEIPYSAFNTIFQFADKELPETTFNRMIIDWSNYSSKYLQVFFISGNNELLMRSRVSLENANQFVRNIIEPAKTYGTFKEVERDGFTSLYIANDKIESAKYTYIIEEKPELFKNVVFTNLNNVVRTDESATTEKYHDGMSRMVIDSKVKSLTYVYPAAESSVRIEPSKLFTDSFEFINEHGGFTDDYRLASTSTSNNQLDYQLYLHGLPIYSDQAINRITTVWGDNRIFRYKRPYFSFEKDIPSEKEMKELPSGSEIVEKIKKLNNIALSDIDDIVVGFYLTYNQSTIVTLEPCWFVIRNGISTKLTPDILGGVKNGLE
ncbi:YycH family regulatory protein [Lysinibacillus xylanilyticus]|uniref:YycH family regulatory protein n=1 Tax=Lysinibacillus xylanilyticus TaxID=582475 RepID=UPI002B24F1F9|nr:two-component system activity regulator YycH [Lysinibacillus xylanilyticus]MEB2280523.1 YycH family regulatory protein [Lysinibacillus xylanilyticus]